MNANRMTKQKAAAGEQAGNKDNSKEYEVEAIVGEQIQNSEVHYRVKWKGYRKRTWEPCTNLWKCQKLIDKFKQKDSMTKLNSPMKLMKAVIRPVKAEQHQTAGLLDEGFGRGLKPQRILRVSDSSGELAFLMKWKGSNYPDLVPARVANVRCPEVVIDFYEKCVVWAPELSETVDDVHEVL